MGIITNNLHAITVRFHSVTNHRNSKISLYSFRFNERIYRDIPDDYNGTVEAAYFWLNSMGYKNLSLMEWKGCYIISTTTFRGFKEQIKIQKYKALYLDYISSNGLDNDINSLSNADLISFVDDHILAEL